MGMIFNIQKFCTQDGPGIRTTVFLKGCPLRCVWCHNPESQSGSCETLHQPEEICGYEMSAEDVIKEVLQDKEFYDNSGGGMTLSGGEPFFQLSFCMELLKLAKQNGIHTCVETCGFVSREVLEQTASWVDLYLFDYKETDSTLHQSFTGVGNETILENLRYLDALGKSIILRCPIIPTCNDRIAHFYGIANVANQMKNLVQIELEPYHSFGMGKYKRLGRPYVLEEVCEPEKEMVQRWASEIKKYTTAKIKIY